MNSTITHLAQLLAPLYLTVSLMLLFRGKLFDAIIDDFKKSPALSYFGGVMALVVGTAWLLAINSFTNFTESVFTIFGIMAIVKGVLLLLFPKTMCKCTCKCPVFKIVGGILTGVIGIWFLHLGYGIF
jgi:hypothetical protein